MGVGEGWENCGVSEAVERYWEIERISDRLRSLSAAKARLDGEIAEQTELLREAVENDFINRYMPAFPHARGKRHKNLADTAAASELACLLRISERAAYRLVQLSAFLVQHHPRTLDALRSGTISWNHAAALLHEYVAVPEPVALELEEALLPIAADTTVPKLAYQARKLRAKLHPEALESRCRDAARERRVDFEPADDAMAWLHVLLTATDAQAIDARLTHTARALQTPQEPRTLTELRADVLTDLLLDDHHDGHGDGRRDAHGGHRAGNASDAGGADDPAGKHAGGQGGGSGESSAGRSARACGVSGPEYHPSAVRAHINVTVPVLTLLGVDDAPADLEGYGPIPADVARRLAAHAPSFTRLLTHPESGAVLSVGRTSYTVPADLKNWLRVRDRTCRHPGCNIPASRCELDHTRPWSHGGLTSHENLAHLCRKHHMLKSEGIWHYNHPDGGTLTATSPGGRTYACPTEPLLI